MAQSIRRNMETASELVEDCNRERIRQKAHEGIGGIYVSKVENADKGRPNPFMNPAIGLSGFGLLLGWQFIILFYPLPSDGYSTMPTDFLLARQIAINASLCVFFILGGVIFSKFPTRDSIKTHVHLYVAIAIGMVGTVILMLFSDASMAATVAAVIMIGASEATIMLLWLRFYSETSKNYSGQTLGVSAIIASMVCFFTYHLTFEVSVIIAVALPLLSGVILIVATRDIPIRHNELMGTTMTDWTSAKRPFIKATVQLMVMSLFFGIVQGCYSTDNMLLPMTNPFSILGAGVAGVVIYILYSKSEFLPNINPVMNLSLILFLGGMLLIPYRIELLSQVAAFIILTGFIFYYILVLIFVIDLVRTFDLNLTIAIGINQMFEYLMFTVGIIAGYLLWGCFGSSPYLAFGISSISSFVVAAAVLAFSTERPPWRAEYYKPVKHLCAECPEKGYPEADEAQEEKATITAFESVCTAFCLTPREIEVFALLSKGRNAEFIQNALFISNHTAKTHIYNIYRKLDVHSLQELLDLLDSHDKQN